MNNSNESNEYQLKIKVINLIELAYKSDNKITVSVIKCKGLFSLKVDQNGNAVLSGKAGTVRFSASEEIDKFGIGFKHANIMFLVATVN